MVSRGPNGKRGRRPVERPQEEWIEIEGASPRIIDDGIWERVQTILADPARTKQRSSMRSYPLRGRLRCGVCGSAMVGQTMRAKGREYRYYGCRHVYDRTTGHECSSRYVRGSALEDGVWGEVRRILTDPTIVLDELKQRNESVPDADQISTLEHHDVLLLAQRDRR